MINVRRCMPAKAFYTSTHATHIHEYVLPHSPYACTQIKTSYLAHVARLIRASLHIYTLCHLLCANSRKYTYVSVCLLCRCNRSCIWKLLNKRRKSGNVQNMHKFGWMPAKGSSKWRGVSAHMCNLSVCEYARAVFICKVVALALSTLSKGSTYLLLASWR